MPVKHPATGEVISALSWGYAVYYLLQWGTPAKLGRLDVFEEHVLCDTDVCSGAVCSCRV